MRIMAIDPGGVTGVALYNSDWALPHIAEIDGSFEHQAWLISIDLKGEYVPDVIICESFIITPNTGKLGSDEQKNYPLMLLGVIRYLASKYGLDFVTQTPAQRKFATDDKLKALGWHKPTRGGHANDAARHLLTYMVRNNLLPAELMQKLADAA